MAHDDAEMSDIVIVLDDGAPCAMDDLIGKLKDIGVAIETVDRDNDVIEGTVETAKLKSIQAIPCVKYVRSVFNYVADYPAGDPRNLDKDDDCDESIPR